MNVDITAKKAPAKKNESHFRGTFRQFTKNKTAVLGLIIFVVILFMALSADIFFNYNTDAIKQNADIRMQLPSAEHFLGTDQYGRDMFARIVYGARMSIFISFSSIILTTVIGCALGGVSAYYGGKLETITMRFMDILLAIPGILFAVTLVAALGTSTTNIIIALSASQMPGTARFMRSLVISLRDQEYVDAARVVGTSDFRIMMKHIMPNAFGPILVNATSTVAYLIIAISSMSFVGLGIQSPTPEWGTMLATSKEYITTMPHLVIIPGLAIVITALSINLLGDGLRDALDPRLK